MLRWIAASQQPAIAFIEGLLKNRKPDYKPSVYGDKPQGIQPTGTKEIEDILVRLDGQAMEWRKKSRKEKAKVLRQCCTSLTDMAEELASLSTEHKGTYGQGIGEEYLGVIPIASYLLEVSESLESDGYMKPYKIRASPDQTQWIVDVFPTGIDTLSFGGFQGELWISSGHGVTQGHTVSEAENDDVNAPGVGLVLGAGNQYPLAILDIFHILIMQSRVVVCKMNPVNEYMGPLLRRALAPLVENGYLEFVYGGPKQGSFLVDHPLVKSIHLTGSCSTYDKILWKGKPKNGEPKCQKDVSAELGCVTPYIIVPGKWSAEDIEYHANNIVSGLVHNAGHNCLKAEVLVTDASWTQREEFLDAVRRILSSTPQRSAYYPGSEENFKRFEKRFPECESLGRDVASEAPSGKEYGSHHPWKFQTGLDEETCHVSEENWCGVLQEVALNRRGDSVAEYLALASDFVNNKCWGTLSCCVFIDPRTQRKHSSEFNTFIANLKYGSICVNVPGMVGFGVTKLTWGAYGDDNTCNPAPCRDIGSGNCKVHNSLLFDNVQKSVIYGPWQFHPFPYWLVSNRNAEEIGKKALEYFVHKSFKTLSGVLVAAFKG